MTYCVDFKRSNEAEEEAFEPVVELYVCESAFSLLLLASSTIFLLNNRIIPSEFGSVMHIGRRHTFESNDKDIKFGGYNMRT